MQSNKIQQPSQELFVEMLSTLPLQPVYGYVDFAADGISLPTRVEENGYERYLVECFEHRIMPFSKLNFEFAYSNVKDNKYERRWCTTTASITRSYVFENVPLDVRDKSIDALVHGGRFNELRVNLADKAFESFKTQLMGPLFKAGYKVRAGDLWLTTYHLTGYDQGDYKENGLTFAMDGFLKGAELDVRGSFEVAKEVKDWFCELAQKYQPK